MFKFTGRNKKYFLTFSSKPPKPPSQYGLLIIIICSCTLIRDYRN